MIDNLSTLQYPKFKLIILALLTLNAVIYSLVDTLVSAVDAVVWLVLLVLYELESNNIDLPFSETVRRWIHNLLIGIIGLTFLGFLFTGELLEALNGLLWFALIAMMESEMRWPHLAGQHERGFRLATIAIFLGLIAMAGVWLWLQAWLDAYDAILWIVAFGFIEVDIVHFLQRKQLAN